MNAVEFDIINHKEQTLCTVFLIFIDFFNSFCTSLHIYCTYIQFIEGEGTKGNLTTGCFLGWAKAIQGKKNVKRKYKNASNYFQLSSPPSARYRNKT